MKSFLTSVTIWTGAIVAALTVVDWLLTEAQKKSLKGWAESAWIWLDDHRMESLVRLLKSYKLQLASSVLVFVVLLLLSQAILSSLGPEAFGLNGSSRVLLVTSLVLLVSIAPVSWFIHSRVTKWLVKRNSVRSLFARCIGRILLVAVPSF
jgi:hypothetical protein